MSTHGRPDCVGQTEDAILIFELALECSFSECSWYSQRSWRMKDTVRDAMGARKRAGYQGDRSPSGAMR